MIDPVTDDWRTVLGQMHGLIVHVPAGLLIAVAVTEFVAFVQRDHGSRLLRTALWVITALAAAVAVITGWLANPGLADELASRHRTLGLVLAAVLSLVVIADVGLPRRLRVLATVVRTAGIGTAAGLLVVAGLLGSAAARGSGAVLAATPAPLANAVAAVLRHQIEPESAAPLAVAETPTPIVSRPPDTDTIDFAEAGPLRIDPAMDRTAFAALFAAAAVPDGPRTLIVTGLPTDPVLRSLLPRGEAVQTVQLSGPAIDDAAAAIILARTPNARTVLLHDSAVTDALVPALGELRSLEWLSVWGTDLDAPAARHRLERARPGLQITGTPPMTAAPFGPVMPVPTRD